MNPRHRFSFAATSLIAALLLGACAKEDAPTPASAEVAQARDPAMVMLKPDMLQRVKVAALAESDVADTLQVPGRIEVDETRLVRIGSNVNGRVLDVVAKVGDRVRAGATLATLSSPELTQSQLSYLRAFSQATLAERAAERAKQLLAADVIGAAELQRRESELVVAQAEVSAAASQLRLLGVPDAAIFQLRDRGKINASLAITSTRDGVVISRDVTPGQVVQPADLLFSVADLSVVWAVGDVPEQEARQVKQGQMVQVEVPALGEDALSGPIVFVSDIVDPDTRTVTVRTALNNAAAQLKPAMLANMKISSMIHRRLTVPGAAVVRENDKDLVFVSEGEGSFRLVPVELGPDAAGRRTVYKGLQPGQKVVVDGAFHLNNERKRAELE